MPGQLLPLAVAGGLGFALSFLIGLISGVSFFEAIFKAFISALVLGGLTFGLMTLLKAQFPELFEPIETRSSDDETIGRTVDITMEPQDSDTGTEGDMEEQETYKGPQDQFVEEMSEDEAEELDEEDSEEAPVSRAALAAARSAQATGEVTHEASEHSEPVGAHGSEGVDEMPELGSFADSFRMQEPPGTKVDEMGPSGTKNRHAEGFDEDPAVVARAVQTVLKRSP